LSGKVKLSFYRSRQSKITGRNFALDVSIKSTRGISHFIFARSGDVTAFPLFCFSLTHRLYLIAVTAYFVQAAQAPPRSYVLCTDFRILKKFSAPSM
jgi:hypothetical protein